MMTHTFKQVAFVKDQAGITRQIPVTVSYVLEGGYKPQGLWVYDESGADRTMDMTEAEYDILYDKACNDAAESIAGEHEQSLEYFNQYIAGDRR